MSALVLDAGERDDRAMMARLAVARRHAVDLCTSAIVLGEVWRDARGRQARLARFLRAVDVRSVETSSWVARPAFCWAGQAPAIR